MNGEHRMPTSKQPSTIGLIQAAAPGSSAGSLEGTLAKTEQAPRDGAQIICTQELFATQYFFQNEDHENFPLAERFLGHRRGISLALRSRLGQIVNNPHTLAISAKSAHRCIRGFNAQIDR